MENNFDIVLNELLAENYDTYCEKLDAAVASEPHVFSEKFCKKMDKLVKLRKRPWYSIVSTPVKKVAVFIILVLVLSFSTAMSIKAAREAILGFFVEVYETFSVVFFGQDNEESGDASTDNVQGRSVAGSMERYEITEVPDGYELVYSYENEWGVDNWYKNSAEEIIKFTYTLNCYKNEVVIDTEKADIKTIEVDNKKYNYVENESFTHLFWKDEKYIFSVKASNLETAKAIISSIKKIN